MGVTVQLLSRSVLWECALVWIWCMQSTPRLRSRTHGWSARSGKICYAMFIEWSEALQGSTGLQNLDGYLSIDACIKSSLQEEDA